MHAQRDQRSDVALACYSLKPSSTNIKLAPCRADKEEEYATPLIADSRLGLQVRDIP
jgi:hypothetical protein